MVDLNNLTHNATGIFTKAIKGDPQAIWTILTPIVIILATVIIAKIISILITAFFKHQKSVIDETQYIILRRMAVVIIYIIGFLIAGYTIPMFKTLSISLFAGAGVLAIVIGFATQKALANTVAGIFIAIFEPFRVGDQVEIDGIYGTVEDVNLRHTVVKTPQNKRIIVPNSLVNEQKVINYKISDEKILNFIKVSISYDSDIDLAKKIMKKLALKHPDFIDVRTETEVLAKLDPVNARVTDYLESGIELKLYVWAKDQPTAWKMRCELLEQIKKEFDKQGIEIPFPYRTIVYKKDIKKKRKR